MNCKNYFKKADIDVFSKIYFIEKLLKDLEYGKLIKIQLDKEINNEL